MFYLTWICDKEMGSVLTINHFTSHKLTDRIPLYYILNGGTKSVTSIKPSFSSQHNPKSEHDLFAKSNHDHHPPGRCAGSCTQQRRIRTKRSPCGLWQKVSQSTLVRAFKFCSKFWWWDGVYANPFVAATGASVVAWSQGVYVPSSPLMRGRSPF